MKCISHIFTALICAVFCTNNAIAQSVSHVSFTVKKGYSLYLSYPLNTVSFEEKIIKSASQDTTLSIQIQSNLPFVIFSSNRKITPYILFPGVDYRCLIASNSTDLHLQCTDPEKQQVANTLVFLETKSVPFDMYSLDFKESPVKGLKAYTKELDTFFDTVYKKRMSVLNQMLHDSKISESSYSLLKSYVWADLYHKKLLPFYALRLNKTKVPDWLLNNLDTLQFSHIRDCDIRLYSVQAMLAYLVKAKSLFKYHDLTLSHLLSVSNHEISSSIVRDFVNYQIINQYKNTEDVEYQDILENLSDYCTNEIYVKRLTEKKNFLKQKVSKEINVLNSLTGERINFVDRVYAKDSIVYIDFWASWCVPCIQEMPHYIDLRNQYKNKKVKFVSISLDENFSSWKSKSQTLGLWHDNYILVGGFSSTFAKEHHITSIPRAILMDKNGSVISEQAPRPSDPKLKALLNKLE